MLDPTKTVSETNVIHQQANTSSRTPVSFTQSPWDKVLHTTELELVLGPLDPVSDHQQANTNFKTT